MMLRNLKRTLPVVLGLALATGLTLWSFSVAQAEDGHAHGADDHAHGADHAHEAPAGSHGLPHAPPVNWTDMSYGDKNVQGEEFKPGDEPMTPPLVLAFLNFAIFAGILYWKAGPALSKYLANRHESIKNSLEEGARLQAEAKEKLAEYSSRIADADAEVSALIEQIRKDAEIEREQMVAEAKRQAELMKADAESRIESEFLTARRQLEREIVAKAAEVATKLLVEKTSASDQANLVSSFIAGITTGESGTSPSAGGQS